MEEKILTILSENKQAFSVYELNDILELSSVEEMQELLKVLNKLETEGKVYRTNKDKYMLLANSHLVMGKLSTTRKGYGFVGVEGSEDIFIAATNLNGAIYGDKVLVEITSKKGVDLEGRILRVVDRDIKQIVGEVIIENNHIYIALDDEKVKIRVEIPSDKAMGAMPGHKVVARIIKPIRDNLYSGEIIKVIGHKNDPGVDILSIVNKFNIHEVFSDEVMQEVENVPREVSPEEIEGRRDLRNQEIFTIDGDDTKDIDDAISLMMLDNGNYKLGVHIADVSHYVIETSAIGMEAESRGTSVYLADRVIPMLPHALSNGICSLNPDTDRLAMSCDMEINHQGDIVTYDIYESVIRSRRQMTYKKVNQILMHNTTPEGYEPFANTLLKMQELATILRRNKERRGYIDFDIDEAKIVVNDKGEAIDVVLRERGVGEKLIEDFMIVANETIATAIYFMELPFLYRIHDKPSEQKMERFIKFVSLLGYKLTGKIKDLTPKAMQNILEQLKDKKEYHILSSMLLRSMQKAVYDKHNIGHFGLASKYYTHFTSPIRRFPDLTVHRLVRNYLFNKNYDNIKQWDEKLTVIGEHSSEMEQSSIECEREVDDMKMAEYMMKHIGEEFTGIISSVTNFGLFVELPNLIEGLVRLDSLKDDYYDFDEATLSVTGKKNKSRYCLGDTLKVKVVSANKDTKAIDFTIVGADKNDRNKQS